MRTRKQVPSVTDATGRNQQLATVLFADICDSTWLFEKYGDWRARQLESRVIATLTARTAEYGGTLIKTIGDEIMSCFADAEKAVSSACEMQAAVKDDPSLLEFGIAIKIGLHHGPVLVDDGDLFGDAVNVAARMVSLARPDQIITTAETIACLPVDAQERTRSLGRSRIRGKRDEMQIIEVIWQESATLTQLLSGGHPEEVQLFARLIIEYRGASIEVVANAERFSVGRGPRNDLIVDQDLVSRQHAVIEFRQGKFILVDASTNGTHVLLENGARFFVQREEFTLHDRGIICLGQAVTIGDPDLIHYQCEQA